MIVAMLGSVAFAQWLAEGEGKGQAQAGVAEDLVVTEAAPSDVLLPGGTAAVALTILNPNPYPVTVTLVEQVPGQDITSDTTGCDPANHGVTFTTQTVSIGVAGGASTTTDLADAAAMSLDSADACQGATFSIPLRVTGAAGDGGGGGDGGTTSTFYADSDGDAYGDPAVTVEASSAPEGYVGNGLDCNDADANVNPDAPEIANGIDDDCDGEVDEGFTSTWYRDADGDGYGDAASTTSASTEPSGYVADPSDCDDTDPSINPGATDTPGDGVDNDCDGSYGYYEDADADGYGSTTTVDSAFDTASPSRNTSDNSLDCDDTNPSVNPEATEITGDGIDNDCDGDIDEGT